MAHTPVIIRYRHITTPVRNNLANRILYGRLADRIITTGEHTADLLAEDLGLDRSRLVSIPTGVDLNRFNGRGDRAKVRAEWDLEDSRPAIGIIAVLRSMKNHRLFLEAAAQLHKRIANARFFIIGDGPLRATLEKQAQDLGLARINHDQLELSTESFGGGVATLRSSDASSLRSTSREPRRRALQKPAPTSLISHESCGPGDAVCFTGHRQDMPDVLAALEVVVLCSSTGEGVPQVIAQALAMQRPVVATEVGSVSELVIDESTGLLIAPDNVEALTEAIARLLQDAPLAARLAASGRRLVEERFSEEKMAEAVEKLLLQLISQK
jgi:glycosyltransferase involved in cell wall biosynthesis